MQPIKIVRIVLLVLIIIGLGLLATQKIWVSKLVDKIIASENPSNIITVPGPMTVTGKQVCLPHKNTSGPQTMECAFGMKADNGLYYALDFSIMPDISQDLGMEDRIVFEGTFTPIEYLSSDHFQNYNIVGVLSVTSAKRIGITTLNQNTLNTKYITSMDWPPQVKIKEDPFKCQIETKTISGNKYCTVKESEGAAGSTYTTYTYSTEYQKKTYSLTFTLRFSQCGNYDEPQRSACEKERASFDIDILADKVTQDSIKPVQMGSGVQQI